MQLHIFAGRITCRSRACIVALVYISTFVGMVKYKISVVCIVIQLAYYYIIVTIVLQQRRRSIGPPGPA